MWSLPKPWIRQEEKTFDYNLWLHKRKWTTRAFVAECLMLGMEYSVTFLTLWLYIKTMIDTDYPKVFYSVISAAYLLACVLFSILIGRYVDQSRCVRKTFLICNTLVIIGNIVYALHFSPWLLLVGRFISGTDGPLRSVVSGEVARCFPDDEVMGKFATMGMAFSVGFIMGPGINFLFTTVDFTIGAWHVTYVNVPGVYMAVIFILTQIFVFFTVSDLSREFDLKSNDHIQYLNNELTKNNENNEADEEKRHEKENSFRNSYHESLRNSFRDSYNRQSFRGDDSTCETSFRDSMIEGDRRQSFQRYLPHEESYRSSVVEDSHDMRKSGMESSARPFETSTQRRRKNIAREKMERSGLYSASFSMSDCFVNASMIFLMTNQQRIQESDPLINEDDDYSEEMPSMGSILLQLLKNVDCVLIFLFTFSLWYWMVAFDMWLPLMVVDVMGMGINELNGIVFGFGCISAIILFIMSYKTFSDSTIFNLSIVSMIALAIMEGIFINFKFNHESLAMNVIGWIVWGTLFAVVVVMDEVFLVGALSKMVSSNVQTFTESIRLSMSRLGALMALLTSALLFEWVEWVCAFAILSAFLSIVMLLSRRKTLSSPKVCIK